jgi:hypothetical protein
LPSELIGLIETDSAAILFDCGPCRQTSATERKHWRLDERAACMTSSELLSTEFVEADIQQLQDELAAEFAQLLKRLAK